MKRIFGDKTATFYEQMTYARNNDDNSLRQCELCDLAMVHRARLAHRTHNGQESKAECWCSRCQEHTDLCGQS